MRNIRTLVFAAVATLVASAGFVGNVAAQGLKIGFVRDDRIYNEYPAWNKAQDQWETERKSWEDEAQTKQDELQEMLDEYNKQKLILSEADDKRT